MTLTQRTTQYDPREHIRVSYPTWFVTTADLGGKTHEIMCPEAKLIVVDPAAFNGDLAWALAHAAAHLDDDMAHLGDLQSTACERADFDAQLRLDRPIDRLN